MLSRQTASFCPNRSTQIGSLPSCFDSRIGYQQFGRPKRNPSGMSLAGGILVTTDSLVVIGPLLKSCAPSASWLGRNARPMHELVRQSHHAPDKIGKVVPQGRHDGRTGLVGIRQKG